MWRDGEQFLVREEYEWNHALRKLLQQLLGSCQASEFVCVCQLLRLFLLETLERQLLMDDAMNRRPVNAGLFFNFTNRSVCSWVILLTQYKVSYNSTVVICAC